MEQETLEKLVDQYLNKGFGSMNKNDFEVWIFHYLMEHQLKGLKNYEISIKLRIPETKVKRLRYEAELKYTQANSLDNYHRVCKLLQNVRFKKDGKCIQFAIEDVYLRKYLDSTLKAGGRFSDSSFNSEVVSIDYDDLEFFLRLLPENNEKMDELLKNAKSLMKNEKLTFNYLMGELCESMARQAGKRTVDLSFVGLSTWLSSSI